MSTSFKFALGALVLLATSQAEADAQAREKKADQSYPWGTMMVRTLRAYKPIERGIVIARSEHLESEGHPPQYLVRYRNGTGCQVEDWFIGTALVDDPGEPETSQDADFSGYAQAEEAPRPVPKDEAPRVGSGAIAATSSTDTTVEGRSITVDHTWPDGRRTFVTIPGNE